MRKIYKVEFLDKNTEGEFFNEISALSIKKQIKNERYQKIKQELFVF